MARISFLGAALAVLLACSIAPPAAALLDSIQVPDPTCGAPSTTYVQANSKTVKRGIINPEFPSVAHIVSGDTITMECLTGGITNDYAKMIKGDVGAEELMAWPSNATASTKPLPILPGGAGHIITGPLSVCGALPGDVLKIEILSLSPRKNPLTGKAYGINSQNGPYIPLNVKNADGTNVSTTSSSIIYEVDFDEYGGWGQPIYGFFPPSLIPPDNGTVVTSATVPHKTNIGVKSSATATGFDPVEYPPGFQSTLNQSTDIQYMDASFNWRIPLRPFLGTIGVTPANAANYINGAPNGTLGASTTAPSRFGGNMDNWRVGTGSTLYVQVEVPEAKFFFGDCHAAQGDAEISGTAIEASLTAVYRISVLPQATLPNALKNLTFPIVETKDHIDIQGFALNNYLDELAVPSQIAQFGRSNDKALANAYQNTRNFLVKGFGMQEREALSLISTGVDFGIAQCVDSNWGVHGLIPKSIFSSKSAAGGGLFSGPASRKLKGQDQEEEPMDLVSILRRFEAKK
ncbi:acetamidase/formamidase [Klebsormidium nitens]|uniref:Acetamidase/formamidase n=1 Tax=Klebsormidium nitens TaxID=105231 RepID=A0A1Y1HLQ0_KLENI|nr:acetamidase/formamidase [Klebsormidium nitens]|eukprot:GAQ79555.1 acetamidase/formamidase [Klebsormidium nitens]